MLLKYFFSKADFKKSGRNVADCPRLSSNLLICIMWNSDEGQKEKKHKVTNQIKAMWSVPAGVLEALRGFEAPLISPCSGGSAVNNAALATG